MSSRKYFHKFVNILNLEHPLLPLLVRIILYIFCMRSRNDFHKFTNSLNLEHPLLPMLPRRPLVDHILHHPPPTQQLLNKTFQFSFNSSKLFLQHLLENRYWKSLLFITSERVLATWAIMAMVIMRVRVTAARPITIHTIALPRLTVASLTVRNKI